MANTSTEYSINYDANTIEKAQEYLDFRHYQLEKFGVIPSFKYVEFQDNVVCAIITKYETPFGENYGSIFILNDFRGKGLFKKYLGKHNIKILTLEECNIEGYLQKIGCEYKVLRHSAAYKIIQKEYRDDRTNRTGLPLMNHIEEGGYLLYAMGADEDTKDAYYLHPILQSDDNFNKNINKDFSDIKTNVLLLVMEYRRVANSYLSYMSRKEFVGFTNLEIKQMLMADKIQNYRDFRRYHFGIHEKSDRLNKYFHNWFEFLGVENKIKNLEDLKQI